MSEQQHQFLFISPHYDDAVLSCATTLMELQQRGHSCQVLTIFGGYPPLSFRASEIARQYAAEDLGLPEAEIDESHFSLLVALRYQEDRRAFQQLGAVRREVLPFPDAIYRGANEQAYYETEEELFGIPHPLDEESLLPQIAKSLISHGKHQSHIWVFPAVSNHVDHQLLTKLGTAMLSLGYRVLFYAEFPYWQQDHRFSEDGWVQADVKSSVYYPAKLTAVLEYKTQLLGLFGEQAERGIRSGEIIPELERFWIREADEFLLRLFGSLGPSPLQPTTTER